MFLFLLYWFFQRYSSAIPQRQDKCRTAQGKQGVKKAGAFHSPRVN